jgi:hypothetical protein
MILFHTSRAISVSIVSDYGLDDRAIGVRSPAVAKDFSSNLCVQTGSEANPASCTIGTGGSFPGAKRDQGVTLTTHPHLVPRSRMSTNYTSSPPSATMTCSGTSLVLFYKRQITQIRSNINVPKCSQINYCWWINNRFDSDRSSQTIVSSHRYEQ